MEPDRSTSPRARPNLPGDQNLIIATTGGRYVAGTKIPIRLSTEQILGFRELLKHLAGSLWERDPHDGRRHEVRHGDAIGTDTHVDQLCKRWGIPVRPFPVVGEIDGPWPAAGPRRSARMMTTPRPAQALAAFPGDRGTASAVRIARSLHLPVFAWDERASDFVLQGRA